MSSLSITMRQKTGEGALNPSCSLVASGFSALGHNSHVGVLGSKLPNTFQLGRFGCGMYPKAP